MAGFGCPTGYLDGCGQVQAMVDETPVFSEEILEDVRPMEPWVGHIETGTVGNGTPTTVTKDRFRHVQVDATQPWNQTIVNGVGCSSTPCNFVEHPIGWGSDRLSFFEEDIHYSTPLMCFTQMMHVTEAAAQTKYIINKILRPATMRIWNVFLMKRSLYWADNKWTATTGLPQFSYQWTHDSNGKEAYFDCSVPLTNFYKLVPQMLQNIVMPLLRLGYAGETPYESKDGPMIDLIADNDVIWDLDRLGGQTGVGGANSPNVLGNWRFTAFKEAAKYWKYGFSGAIGNFMVRMDTGGMRFNFVGDMGAAYGAANNGNRYRYQWVEPLINVITTGAGGAAGLGSINNPAYDNAQIRLSHIQHPKALKLLYRESSTINSEMSFLHQDMGGRWQFVKDNLGVDENNLAIENKRGNKGQFIADFYAYAEPGNTEWAGTFLHKAERMPIPLVSPFATDPGYPTQSYVMEMTDCPVVNLWNPVWGTPVAGSGGVPIPGPIAQLDATLPPVPTFQ
jgi:hypothetical protein